MILTSRAYASTLVAGFSRLGLRMGLFGYVLIFAHFVIEPYHARIQMLIHHEFSAFQIWDIARKRIRDSFQGHAQEVYSLVFSWDGRLIVSGSGDRTARIWDVTDGSSMVLKITDVPDNVDAGVISVAISLDGQLVATGGYDTVRQSPNRSLDVSRIQFHRSYVSGTLARVKYWGSSGNIPIACTVWHSPLMDAVW